MEKGLDTVGLQHKDFPINRFLRSIPTGKKIVCSSLDASFGESIENIIKSLESGKISSYKLSLLNGPGLRNRRLAEDDPLYGYTIESLDKALTEPVPDKRTKRLLSYLDKQAILFDDVFKGFPNIDLYVLPILETNQHEKAWRKVATTFRSKMTVPFTMVYNPQGTQHFDTKFEEHHSTNAPVSSEGVSLDGQDGDDVNIPAYLKKYKNSKYVLTWYKECNGLSDGPWVYPKERENWPTQKQLDAWVKFLI